jgi:transcriptional regulator with AAA-type ATPase domain
VHLRIRNDAGRCFVEDVGSKNGTFVDGEPIGAPVELRDQALIRAGRVLLVFQADAGPLLSAEPEETFGIAGRFHAPRLVADLEEASRSRRNLLLTGPSGSGKELAAGAIAGIEGRPLLAQNAARFSSEDEAAATLFGVGSKVFSEVGERPGYIERADGGALFLDEAHNLPPRVQKSLLRVIEDAELARIGRTETRKVDVRFVLASNEPPPDHGLAEDLLARLRKVELPPLVERKADIPEIFDQMLKKELRRIGCEDDPRRDLLEETHYEALILDGFEETNARGLQDLADRIATRADVHKDARRATGEIMAERYGRARSERDTPAHDRPTTKTTIEIPRPEPTEPPTDRQLVKSAFEQQGGNAAAIVRELKKRGRRISRRKAAKLLDELGLPRIRRG